MAFVRHLATMQTVPQDAADTVFALVSPHVHQMMRRHAHRTAAEYREWLADTVAAIVGRTS